MLLLQQLAASSHASAKTFFTAKDAKNAKDKKLPQGSLRTQSRDGHG